MTLDGFRDSTFTHDGATRPLFLRGEGPGVVIMHEMPGITPAVASFARRVADDGFSVYMPNLFGEPGRRLTPGYALSQMAQGCVSRDFSVLAAREASPITEWLRALCRFAHQERGGRGVGALGMCFTGNFALTLALDEAVMAPVLSQPSLPFGVTKEKSAGVHATPEALANLRRRGVPVMGLRFTADPLCKKARFDTLRSELGELFRPVEIDNRRGNPHGIPAWAHSVVTNDLVDREGHPTREALERVLAFFHERLDEGDGGQAAR